MQFPARRDGAEQDGATPRGRSDYVRDEIHNDARLYDGPPLLPSRPVSGLDDYEDELIICFAQSERPAK